MEAACPGAGGGALSAAGAKEYVIPATQAANANPATPVCFIVVSSLPIKLPIDHVSYRQLAAHQSEAA
jgi:hypothetical protein